VLEAAEERARFWQTVAAADHQPAPLRRWPRR